VTSRVRFVRRLRPIPIALAVAVLAALWFTRPVWHGIVMIFWTAPLVWLPPVALLVLGWWLVRRSRRSWTTLEELRQGVRPPVRLLAFPIAAFFVFILASGLNGPLVERSIVGATTYEPIRGLPPGGQVRLVPREVAEQNASSAFNSPTETLTDFHIVNTGEGLRWTALRTPQGAFRVFTKKSQGLVELDAQQTARSLRQVDAQFDTAPGLQLTDNLRWRLLKRRYLVRLEEPVAIETARGPRIVVPYLQYKGILVRRPVLGGVFVVAPGGTIEDLEPAEAARRPELANSGRVFPDSQARRLHDAYRYKGGLFNAWFVHENQTQITDTEVNRQPYLIDFEGSLGLQWVTVAEPYGRDLPHRRGDRQDADLPGAAAHVAERQPARHPGGASGVDPRHRLRKRARRVGQLPRGRAAAGVRAGAARLPHVDHPQHGERGLQDGRGRRRDEQARGDLRQRPRPTGRGEDPPLHRHGRGARGRDARRRRRRRGRRRRAADADADAGARAVGGPLEPGRRAPARRRDPPPARAAARARGPARRGRRRAVITRRAR
jgi:hypothetical protein